MRLTFRVISIAGPLFRPLTPELAGSSPFFARPFGSERTAYQAAFLSLRMTMKSSEGGGGNATVRALARLNRPNLLSRPFRQEEIQLQAQCRFISIFVGTVVDFPCKSCAS
jgi:hypothetical protein